MIDFRYHLVSIVAIFLALGLGILLGSTALKPSALSLLEKTSASQKTTIDDLYAAERQLKQEITSNQQFAQAAESRLLNKLLTGQRVVVVEAPGASSQMVSGIVHALKDAGAAISGQVHLRSSFLDASPAAKEQLQQLAQELAPGLVLGGGTAQAQASQVLAGALVSKDPPGGPGAGQRDDASAAVLSGFGDGGFLTVSGQPAIHATLAVLVTPASPPHDNTSNAASEVLVTLAQQLRLAGQGTVVAGSVSGSSHGSAIDIMRAGGRAGHVSSVDDADHVLGQIVVVQALAEQLRGGHGSYGATSSAVSGAGPSPAPTPSPSRSAPLGGLVATPPASPSPHPSRSGKKP